MYVIGGIIAFNLLKILLNVTEIKNYYTNHIIFLEISIVLGIVFFLSLIGVIYNVLKKKNTNNKSCDMGSCILDDFFNW